MDIVEKAEAHVFHLFKDKLSPDYIYHNFNHTLRVVHNAALIAKEEGISDDEAQMVILAAWFHDLGYIDGDKGHEKRSAGMAEKFLEKRGYPEDKIKTVVRLIEVTEMQAIGHHRVCPDGNNSHPKKTRKLATHR